MKYLKLHLVWGGGVLMALAFWAGSGLAQTRYELRIKDVTYLQVHKNWLQIPKSADLRLQWEVLVRRRVDGQEQMLAARPEELDLTYQVYVYQGDTDSEPLIREVQATGHTDFTRLEVGQKFIFKIRAYSPNSMLVAESAPVIAVVGKGEEGEFRELAGKTWRYYLHPGRWQLMTVGKADIYDKSTRLGKAAFIFLSISTFLSLGIMIFYSTRTLYLGNIFPFKRSKRDIIWSFTLSCDNAYEKRLTTKFKFILKAWETIATNSRKVADRAAKNVPSGLSSTEKMASVDVACMEYWTHDGDRAISTIEDIIAFPDESRINGRKNVDDMLAELVIKIEDSFQDLISKNGEASQNGSSIGDMQTLIDEIYEPVINDNKLGARLRKWILRKGVFDMRKGLKPFPTSKIIQSGLEIHRMNGYRWLKPSEEVKRAFEDRASIEIEHLRRKSRIEWFWNYAALAPLVGLFGTVTGITYAFQQLTQNDVAPNFVSTIQHLSNGIFEALWTTIFGLANGIIFLLVYYYFKHKLDWIYAKWEEIYINITEKL